MSRLATSFVLGYHGCEREIAEKAVSGDISLLHSNTPFDWLGPGSYFWESDPHRAQEWAQQRKKNGDYTEPTVIGAVIDLRNCLDLLTRADQELLTMAYASLSAIYEKAGKPLPENKNSKRGGDKDRRMRLLDCAVIKHLHGLIDDIDGIDEYDSIRGMFTEGDELYSGSAFYHQSHVQIAVRNNNCVRGLFFPPELTEE